MGKKVLMIDLLGDGVYIKVPKPVGDCLSCKFYKSEAICKRGCNIANGMKYFEPTEEDND